MKSEGITTHGIVLDITDRDAYERAADEVEAVFGAPPTLLFNTAGVNSFGPVENSTYGRVADIHHLLPESGLHIVDETFVRVHISLLGVPGTRLEDIT